MPDEINIEVKSGYVAFFDILGYREMTSQQDFKTVIEVLQQAKTDAEKLISAARAATENLDYELFTFGDSMIVFCAIKNELSPLEADRIFPIYLRSLFARMFNRGMPMRGAIAKGEFYFKDKSYAGRPLNEAYEYANSLEFAGCVLAPSAEDLVVDSNPDLDLAEESYFKKVSVPIKNQGSQELYVMKQSVKANRQDIVKAFQEHGKSIMPAVLPKLNNTVQILGQVFRSAAPQRPKK